jgi:hypothetical protein
MRMNVKENVTKIFSKNSKRVQLKQRKVILDLQNSPHT